MQFKVPQNVQQADRIVGPLTFLQLIICIVGVGFAYATFSVLANQGLPALIWAIPVGIILMITAAFAFLKINNLPFHKLLALLIERIFIPSKRVWVKGADRVSEPEGTVGKKSEKKEETSEERKEAQYERLDSISSILDKKKEDPAEKIMKKIDQTEDNKLIEQAFVKEKQDEQIEKPKEREEKTKKILDLSKKASPKSDIPAHSAEKAKDELQTSHAIPPKKKTRRRRRKRNNTNSDTLISVSKEELKTKEAQAKETQKSMTRAEKTPEKQEEKPLPSWLQDGVKEKTAEKKEPTAEKAPKSATEPTDEIPERKKRRRRKRKRKRNKNTEEIRKTAQVPEKKQIQTTDSQTTVAIKTEAPTQKTEAKQETQSDTPPLASWLEEGLKETPAEKDLQNVSESNEADEKNLQTLNKKAKTSEEFSADDLKKGQEISFD
ncbi:MAG: PrgI family protein [Candidatus Gracilibacteria bacterium]|nr:PrgI family protein [Candidatus Gracilibacteria bacterium]